jgi:hypothetical protein
MHPLNKQKHLPDLRTIAFYQFACMALCSLILIRASVADAEDEKAKTRIEELFAWKVSDSLSLDTKEEQVLVQLLKDISEKRSLANQKIEKCLEKLASTSLTKPELQKNLTEYKSLLTEQSKIQIQELDQIEKKFGKEKLAQYIVMKNELTNKFRDFLSQSKTNKNKTEPKPTLSEPKIIEQK